MLCFVMNNDIYVFYRVGVKQLNTRLHYPVRRIDGPVMTGIVWRGTNTLCSNSIRSIVKCANCRQSSDTFCNSQYIYLLWIIFNCVTGAGGIGNV